MKKIFLILTLISLTIGANAQVTPQKSTTAKPISNGCGSEKSGVIGTVATKAAQAVDYIKHGSSASTQSCDQHDKDYYNGVPKETADDSFENRSPNMGSGMRNFGKNTSTESYQEAQQDRKTSEKLQATWEKENKQCLDKENYKVEHNKTYELEKKLNENK